MGHSNLCKSLNSLAFSVLILLCLTGCISTGGVIPTSEVVPTVPKPIAPIIGTFLTGPAGASLSEADRDRAAKAQLTAASSGKRTQWRAERTDAYGYVEPGTVNSSSAGCRTYQHVIYTGGRSQRGAGEACPSADGSWAVVN